MKPDSALAVERSPAAGARFRFIVFDWDGTLMDSAAAIVAALQAACIDLGLGVPADKDARYIIGLGLRDALSHLLPGVDAMLYPRIAERYRHHFTARDAATRLFPGAGELIAELHRSGRQLAIATGKSRRGLDRALTATGLQAYFHASRCADEGHTKPHPGMLHTLMEELAAAPDETLMIGDTTHDLDMAAAAGVAAVGVAYGAHGRELLSDRRPLACVDSLQELSTWLGCGR